MEKFIVTPAAMRPASKENRCFYCLQPVGAHHNDDCVLVRKRIRVRWTMELDILNVPAHWSKSDIHFHYNEGTSCKTNVIQTLARHFLIWNNDGPCACNLGEIEYLRDEGKPFLVENTQGGVISHDES